MKIYTVPVSKSPTSPLEFVGNYETEAEAERVIDDLYEIRYGVRPAVKEGEQYTHPNSKIGQSVFADIAIRNQEDLAKVRLSIAREVDEGL